MVTMQESGGSVIFYGLSTDTKPTHIERVIGNQYSIPNGAAFYEINTGDIYMYDAENSTWIKQ